LRAIKTCLREQGKREKNEQEQLHVTNYKIVYDKGVEYFRIIFLGLFFFLGVTSGFPQADDEEGPKQIYLKSLTVHPSLKEMGRELEKNAYDVIYSTNKFELYLVDKDTPAPGFLQFYDAFAIKVLPEEVEVTMKGKRVLRRHRGTSSPVLNLRLAMYELLLGENYVLRHQNELIQRSLERMARIKRILEREARKDEPDEKSSVMTEPLDAAAQAKKKRKSPLQAPSQSSRVSSKLEDGQEEKEGENKSKSSIKRKASKSPTLLRSQPAYDDDDDDDVDPGYAPEPSADPSVTNAPSAPAEVLRPISPPSPVANQTPAPVAEKLRNTSRPVVKKQKQLVDERSTRLIFTSGISNFQGYHDQIIDTLTTLNFFQLGLQYDNFLIQTDDPGFFSNLDYSFRGGLGIEWPFKKQKYNSTFQRQAEIYAGTPLKESVSGWGGGGVLSFQNVQVAALKGFGEGVSLANINAFFLGPELKYLRMLRGWEVLLGLSYQQAIFDNSSLQKADFDLARAHARLSVIRGPRGLSLEFDRFDGKSAVSSAGAGTFSITALRANFLYFFDD
jgi:hypothetical protein